MEAMSSQSVVYTLGAHALPGFALLLLGLLVGSAAAWWTLRRVVVPHQHSTLAPLAFLAVRMSVGFAIVVAAGALFAEVAEELHAQEQLGALDEAFSAAIRETVSRPTLEAFAWVTRLGDPATVFVLGTVVAALLVWHGRRWLAIAWVLTVTGNGLLNLSLKAVFARVRPLHDHGILVADGWSFPSGHSSGSVVAYGMLAYVLVRVLPQRWHLPVVLVATALAFATGCSRVFLQVHYVSDVVAGFASGLAWLAVCVTSFELMRHYRRTRSPSAARR